LTFLPIIDRELRARARAKATYWTRLAVGLLGVLICLPQLALSTSGTPGAAGRFSFNAIVAAGFLLCCGACLLTADSISGERRDGTLGLLFLTRVRGADVLAGKLGSVGISSLGALMALLPVLMFPVLAGGVAGGETFRIGLALINTLFFAQAAGLCASAARSDRFQAVRRALALVGTALLGPVLLQGFLLKELWPPLLSLPSPLVQVLCARDAAYRASPRLFWISFGLVNLASWGLLIRANFVLRRSLCEREKTPSSTAREGSVPEVSPMARDRRWQGGEANPIEWLIERQRVNGAVWALGTIGLAFSGWVRLVRGSGGIPGFAASWLSAWPLGAASGLLGAAIIAWVASRCLVEARRTRELELLLTTPMGAAGLISEQWRMLNRLFPWVVLVMQLPIWLQAVMAMSSFRSPSAPSLELWWLLCMANTFVGALALCRVGLWLGMRARGTASAVVWTVSLGFGIPYLLDLALLILFPSQLNVFGAPAAWLRLGRWEFPFAPFLSNLMLLAFFLCLIGLGKRGLSSEMERTEAFTSLLARSLADSDLELTPSGS
jgi:ABC-2 family transporter protein